MCAAEIAAVATAFTLALTGCGRSGGGPGAPSSASPAQAETASNEPPAVERRCPGGVAQPIAIDDVVAAAAKHGITLLDDPTCADPSAVAQAANVVLYGPHANRDREDEIVPEQGAVTCWVAARPGPGDTSLERVQYEGDAETSFRLANLECVIYPDAGHADEQPARLEAALEDLAEALARTSAGGGGATYASAAGEPMRLLPDAVATALAGLGESSAP